MFAKLSLLTDFFFLSSNLIAGHSLSVRYTFVQPIAVVLIFNVVPGFISTNIDDNSLLYNQL